MQRRLADGAMPLGHWGRTRRARAAGVLLITAGLLVAAWLAHRGGDKNPPTGTESALLVILSSSLNIAGAVAFASVGRAREEHARSAVRRLLATGRALARAEVALEASLGATGQTHLRTSSEVVRETLVASQLALRDAIEDWNEVHREALSEVIAEEGVQP